MFGSIEKTAAAGDHRRATGIFNGRDSKNIPAVPRHRHLALRRACLQQPICKKS